MDSSELLTVIRPLAKELIEIELLLPSLARRIQLLGEEEARGSRKDLRELYVARALTETSLRNLKELRYGAPLDRFLTQLAVGEDPEGVDPVVITVSSNPDYP
jgi:hypothetical protein